MNRQIGIQKDRKLNTLVSRISGPKKFLEHPIDFARFMFDTSSYDRQNDRQINKQIDRMIERQNDRKIE